MPHTRFGLIVRCAAMVMAVVVLLVAWYVGAWLVVSQATRAGIVGAQTSVKLAPVFEPLRHYSGSDLPGSRHLHDVWWAFNPMQKEPGRWTNRAWPLAPHSEGQVIVGVDGEVRCRKTSSQAELGAR